MIKIIAPGSTSNLGPGFDCLGMALNIYNRFTVEEASETALFGVEDSHNNRDNLFLKAYRKGCAYGGRQPHIHVHFDCDVPISRGLGSSSTLIAAGLTAAAYMQDEIFGKDTIFQLAAEMEGHPDNAAPCVFGGMTASSMLEDGSFITRRLNVHPDWLFTVLVPDFEVSTEKARAILPDSYSRPVAVRNSSNAILTVQALESGDPVLLNSCCRDQIHEPYRAALIPGFDTLKEITEKDTGGRMLISGSGSTCLLISKKPLSQEAHNQIAAALPDGNWQIKEARPDQNGTGLQEE